MKGPNAGQLLSKAWQRIKPGPPMTAEERAESDREWAELNAQLAAQRAEKRAKFLGQIVAVEDGDGDVLVYADGRRLRIISDWYEWETPTVK